MAPFLLVTKSSPPSGGLTKSRVFASHFPSGKVQNEAESEEAPPYRPMTGVFYGGHFVASGGFSVSI
jgi:hypothetical protein